MKEKKILFKNKNGLHARPSAQVVALAQAYKDCECYIVYEGNRINAKSILNLIMNAIPGNRYLTIVTHGEGEEELLAEVCRYLEQEVLINED